jgi:copper(I)-binding protein
MRRTAILCCVALLPTACTSSAAIEVRDAVIAVPAGPATAMYFEITNTGEAPDRLVGVQSEVGIAEVHRSFFEGGLMHMEPVPEVIIGGGEVILFAPGGLHIMLIEVAELEAGHTATVTLEFETAGNIEVEGRVVPYAEIVP